MEVVLVFPQLKGHSEPTEHPPAERLETLEETVEEAVGPLPRHLVLLLPLQPALQGKEERFLQRVNYQELSRQAPSSVGQDFVVEAVVVMGHVEGQAEALENPALGPFPRYLLLLLLQSSFHWEHQQGSIHLLEHAHLAEDRRLHLVLVLLHLEGTLDHSTAEGSVDLTLPVIVWVCLQVCILVC